MESIEWERAQNQPSSTFDRHSAEISQSTEEIKVLFRVAYLQEYLAHLFFLSGFFVSGGPTTQKKEELLINLLSNRKGSVEYVKNMTSKDDGGDPNDPPWEDVPDWSMCSHCMPVENPQEQKCCGLKKCITSFQLVPNLCLDRNVLEVAIKAQCDMHTDEIDFSTSSYHKAAYRQYLLWRCGRLSKGNWQWFEYVNMKLADGQEKRKLQLVTKETAPGELFQFLKSLLKHFPSHQFHASW